MWKVARPGFCGRPISYASEFPRGSRVTLDGAFSGRLVRERWAAVATPHERPCKDADPPGILVVDRTVVVGGGGGGASDYDEQQRPGWIIDRDSNAFFGN